MGSVIDGFDWDDANREKCSKHGVTIAEIGALLSGLPDVALDLRHSEMEVRLIAMCLGGRCSWPSQSAPGWDGACSVRSVRVTCMRRRSEPVGKRKVPELRTDAAAEAFLEQDLSGLDFAQFTPMRFEFERKTAQLNCGCQRRFSML
jgi:hypothetical protein